MDLIIATSLDLIYIEYINNFLLQTIPLYIHCNIQYHFYKLFKLIYILI